MTPLEEILNDLVMKCLISSARGCDKLRIREYAQKILALIPKADYVQNGYGIGYHQALSDVRRAMGGEVK